MKLVYLPKSLEKCAYTDPENVLGVLAFLWRGDVDESEGQRGLYVIVKVEWRGVATQEAHSLTQVGEGCLHCHLYPRNDTE